MMKILAISLNIQNFYDNKTGLYNLRLFAQVLGQGFDKAYSDKIIDAFGMRPYIKKKVKNIQWV